MKYVLVLLLVGSIAATDPASYRQGYEDAKAGRPNAFPLTIPTPPPNGSDISDLLNSATTPVNLPVGHYIVSKPIALTQSVKLNGSTIIFPAHLGAANVRFIKPGLTFDNFIAPVGEVMFEPQADGCTVSNFTIGVGPGAQVNQAFHTGTGATNFTMINGHVGLTDKVSAYIACGRANPGDVGARLENVQFDGAVNGAEYALRFDPPDVGPGEGQKPAGALVKNCRIINAPFKDTIGIREFDDVTITCDTDATTHKPLGTILGNIRIGQASPATTVGQFANNIVISNVAFTSNASPRNAVTGDHGAAVTVSGCTFTGYAVPPLTADSVSVVTTKDNTQQSYEGERPPEFWAASSKGTHVDGGGDKSIVIPKP